MTKKEEIINALSVIQKVCKQHAKKDICNPDCPFHKNPRICMITDLEPDNWKLNNPNDTTWKALL